MKIKNKLMLSVAIGSVISGCASDYVNQNQLNSINSVAIVVYNVPEYVAKNTEEPENITSNVEPSFGASDLLSFAGAKIGGITKDITDVASQSHIIKQIDGMEAANITVEQFAIELSEAEGWKVVPPSKVTANPVYQAASKSIMENEKVQTSISFARASSSPSNFIPLTLPRTYSSQPDYVKQEVFTQGMAKISRALNVDAVIVINDTGFATDQESLFSGGDCFTKSALQYAMFDVNGQLIVDTRASFEKSPIGKQQGCVNGAFHKTDYVDALKQHGKMQASVIHDKLTSLRSM